MEKNFETFCKKPLTSNFLDDFVKILVQIHKLKDNMNFSDDYDYEINITKKKIIYPVLDKICNNMNKIYDEKYVENNILIQLSPIEQLKYKIEKGTMTDEEYEKIQCINNLLQSIQKTFNDYNNSYFVSK